jgi:hypothetical protein
MRVRIDKPWKYHPPARINNGAIRVNQCLNFISGTNSLDQPIANK